MLTTQIILLGVAFEVEVEYTITPGDNDTGLPASLDINSVYILGAWPEGIASASRKTDSVYLNYRCDLDYLTLEEQQTLEDACWKHAEEQAAEVDYE